MKCDDKEFTKQISRSCKEYRVFEILKLEIDIIIKYRLENELIKTVPIYRSFLQKYYSHNQNESITNVLKFYISIDKDLQILKIFKYSHKEFMKNDFEIKILKTQPYYLKTLLYVKIRNKKTETNFEDWVYPEQIKSLSKLNNLICWEKKGDEIYL